MHIKTTSFDVDVRLLGYCCYAQSCSQAQAPRKRMMGEHASQTKHSTSKQPPLVKWTYLGRDTHHVTATTFEQDQQQTEETHWMNDAPTNTHATGQHTQDETHTHIHKSRSDNTTITTTATAHRQQ
jgi:hypothetical protein